MKKYKIIYADPPWRYARSKVQGAAEKHYPTMSIEELCALPVKEIADKDCILFLWATFPQLKEALQLIKAWGFTYKSVAFVWLKQNRKSPTWFYGLGFWTRGNAEICLLATKGHPKRQSNKVHQFIISPVEQHSKKPDITREKILTAAISCGGYTFTAKGKTTLCEGWCEIEKLSRAASEEQDEDAEPETVLPPLAEGQTFDNPAAEISERYTQPPKAYTEDTLLSAMENAGKEETPEDAERKGLGTTATRAGIIEKLISAGFAERKGKKLIPTKDGYNLAAILPEVLTSPQLTAEWETRLTGIAKGSDSPDDFMRSIEEMTAGLVKTYSAISEDKAKLFTPQREAIGTCPRCGAAVYEGKKNYYCSDRACSFVMWKNDLFFQQRKKTFTKAIAAALLKDRKVKIKGMYSTKTGKTFDGVVLLADTGGKYVNFRVEQNRK